MEPVAGFRADEIHAGRAHISSRRHRRPCRTAGRRAGRRPGAPRHRDRMPGWRASLSRVAPTQDRCGAASTPRLRSMRTVSSGALAGGAAGAERHADMRAGGWPAICCARAAAGFSVPSGDIARREEFQAICAAIVVSITIAEQQAGQQAGDHAVQNRTDQRAHQKPLHLRSPSAWLPANQEQQRVEDDQEQPQRDDGDRQRQQHQHRLDQHVQRGPAPARRSSPSRSWPRRDAGQQIRDHQNSGHRVEDPDERSRSCSNLPFRMVQVALSSATSAIREGDKTTPINSGSG